MKVLICVLGMLAMLTGCYDDDSGDYGDPQPAPAGSEWSDVIKPIVADSCALSGCHANAPFLASGAAMKASGSLARISSSDPARVMPKPGSGGDAAFSAEDRATLIAYLSE